MRTLPLFAPKESANLQPSFDPGSVTHSRHLFNVFGLPPGKLQFSPRLPLVPCICNPSISIRSRIFPDAAIASAMIMLMSCM